MKWTRRTQTILLTSVLAFALFPTKAYLAEEDIRVALFIDTGQGYRNTIPTVRLSSDEGLYVRLASKDTAAASPLSVGTSARFSVDEFTMVAAETTDLAQAQRAAQQLIGQKLAATITADTERGRIVYQVLSGSYTTYADALNQSKALTQKGFQPKIRGPYRLEISRFPTLQQAIEWENAFETTGPSANTVIMLEASKLSYAVWVGSEVSTQGRDQLAKTLKQSHPAFSYTVPEVDTYVCLHKELATNTGNDVIYRYAFSPLTKLAVSSAKADGLVQVVERENRKYRGRIELSDYKSYLTVVNQLPMEQYLYGVVGSEMVTGWPKEALKTQAVLARTRAVGQGNKYGVANVSDTVFEQAYYGFGREANDIREAVNETAGEIIRYNGKVAQSFYYSNAGGQSADGSEVWGNSVPYLVSVPSDDEAPARAAKTWYRVALSDGTIGFIRSDLVQVSGEKNTVGLEMAMVTTDNANLRIGPSTTVHRSIKTLTTGSPVTILAKEPEDNAFYWTRGPYTSQEVTAMVNASQKVNKAEVFTTPVQSLRITAKGPSGRVTKIEANGTVLAVSSPDAHRSIFRQGDSSLRSSKFDVEERGTFTVMGAENKVIRYPTQTSANLRVIDRNGTKTTTPNGNNEDFVMMNDAKTLRVASKQPMFTFRGYGFGHGLGVSQFGAKAMAEKGYDYRQILQHYYKDITIGP